MLFSVIFIALAVGHVVADLLAQTDHQATTKGAPGNIGRQACFNHCATLTLTQALALVGVAFTADISPATAALALAVNGASHYWTDRRVSLAGLVAYTDRWLHKSAFFATELGRSRMDQAFHVVWLFLSAIIATLPLGGALTGTAVALVVLAGCEMASRRGRILPTNNLM